MPDDLDRLLDQLGDAAAAERLDRLEADVALQISGSRQGATETPWRVAAVGIALVAGLSVGGTADEVRGSTSTAPLFDGAQLAPSALLNPSR